MTDETKQQQQPKDVQMQLQQQAGEDDPQSLSVLANRTWQMIRARECPTIGTIPPEMHPSPPFIAKPFWTMLGNVLKDKERPSVDHISGQYWISLRCDGTAFSKLIRQLQRAGLFQNGGGWSQDLAEIMTQCCTTLLTKFSGVCGYTHSDEMTVLIAPASVVRGEQQPHVYNGRVQKLCSLAASIVTASFNHHVRELCVRQKVDFPGDHMLATFDCRVGMYDTKLEALSLLFWRAYDCGVNGVSDAVHRSRGKIEGAKKMTLESTKKKLLWLHRHDILPLPAHQREGTYLVKRKRVLDAVNQKTGEAVKCLRSKVEHVPGDLILLAKEDKMFPPDEALDPADVPEPRQETRKQKRKREKAEKLEKGGDKNNNNNQNNNESGGDTKKVKAS